MQLTLWKENPPAILAGRAKRTKITFSHSKRHWAGGFSIVGLRLRNKAPGHADSSTILAAVDDNTASITIRTLNLY